MEFFQKQLIYFIDRTILGASAMDPQLDNLYYPMHLAAQNGELPMIEAVYKAGKSLAQYTSLKIITHEILEDVFLSFG